MSMIESDWKKFKELRKIALDRFCQGVLADTKTITQHGALSAHSRYGMIYGLINNRNRDMARMFDGLARSSASWKLTLMVSHDLLTDAELSILSDDARRAVSDIERRPYEIDWVEETAHHD
ncbi:MULTISPECIES: hypothetical protein [Pseudomonas]|uniref:hypothetical protein n=1 Tax=Pseudomonas TaxID=286 RepID=UPI000BA3F9AB|nr:MULTISPECIES: hypothetical protein [Pseudomonas]MDR9864510.1 hypothetical protein [Pseudomonas baetica]